MFIIIAFFALPLLLVLLDFVVYLFNGKRFLSKGDLDLGLVKVLDFVFIVIYPLFYFFLIDETKNDCCQESATFSPEHKLTIYIFILISIGAYFYSALKKRIASPVVEVLINSMLLGGIILNVFIGIQIHPLLAMLGNIPIIILFTFQLVKNHKIFLKTNKNRDYSNGNFFEKIAWRILELNMFFKIPVLLIVFLPVLSVISSLLLLFGQKPDSLIRVFTDTYKHGFSQLDYECANVECGGHFLCSVAANGHKVIVRPVRYGERMGNKIICNRQLLVANAFEELIEQNFPKIHKAVRSNYNRVGVFIHRYYDIFNNKLVSDLIFILMKPLEFLFTIVLYTVDRNPEDRIACQYLSISDREKLNGMLNTD
ncbi:DUF6688 domain-containing protein [Sporocytophaga myxococcoides]|uniref:DUF6688 domain-containing protein n=1 Tax=Sporocytophaga myxococcoides TaxID=153721 RepID=UPI000412A72C|nr:DUF6688 family protein [Sporocytophaga myxococcoides]